MVVCWGTRLYGKSDHIPGLFYTKTRFFYLQFVPLIPYETVLVLDGSEKDGMYHGASVPFSFKGALLGWFRAALIVGGFAFAACAGAGAVAASDAKDQLGVLMMLGVAVGILAVAGLLYWGSYKIIHPSQERAHALAEHLGIAPELIEHYYLYGAFPESTNQQIDGPPPLPRRNQ